MLIQFITPIGLIMVGLALLSSVFAAPSVAETIMLSGYPTRGQVDARYGGTLVMGTANPPTILNPILTEASVSATLNSLIFNSLIRIDAKGDVQPGLAQSWTMSDDAMIFTFKLRPGIRFHDGVECTVADVEFTYQQIMDPQIKCRYKVTIGEVAKFERLDRYQFRITLKKPDKNFLQHLTWEVAPKHLLGQEDLLQSSHNYQPIGTGPFKFKSWDRKTNQIRLVANDEYFEGRPYLDHIIVKTYADVKHLWSAFMREEVDLVKFIGLEDCNVMLSDQHINIHKIAGAAYSAITYDLQNNVLGNVEVRQAIAMAIDKDEIIRQVFDNNAMISTGPFYPGSLGYNTDVKPFEYDPMMAKMILMHHGWQFRDDERVLEKGGKIFEIEFYVQASSQNDLKVAALIRQQLSQIGIRIKIIRCDDVKLFLQKPVNDEYVLRAWLGSYISLGVDLNNNIDNMISLSNQYGALWNYKSERIGQLLIKAKVVLDARERAHIYQTINQIVYEEQPMCFLFSPVSYHAIAKKFQNTDEYFTASMPSYTIKNWFVRK